MAPLKRCSKQELFVRCAHSSILGCFAACGYSGASSLILPPRFARRHPLLVAPLLGFGASLLTLKLVRTSEQARGENVPFSLKSEAFLRTMFEDCSAIRRSEAPLFLRKNPLRGLCSFGTPPPSEESFLRKPRSFGAK